MIQNPNAKFIFTNVYLTSNTIYLVRLFRIFFHFELDCADNASSVTLKFNSIS